MILWAPQCRAARALLGWTQADLATKAGVSRATVADYETNRRTLMRQNTNALVRAFEAAGLVLIDDDRGIGVRFREPGRT